MTLGMLDGIRYMVLHMYFKSSFTFFHFKDTATSRSFIVYIVFLLGHTGLEISG